MQQLEQALFSDVRRYVKAGFNNRVTFLYDAIPDRPAV